MPILLGASVMLSLAMGLRQSLGIFAPALTQDLGITMSDFTLAIATQNLAWGLLQPFAGAVAARWGYRRVMVGGSLSYLFGLAVLAAAQGTAMVIIGAGVAIGAALACTGPAMAMATAARPVSVGVRSAVMGAVSATGSLGALLSAPIGQALNQAWGWRVGLAGFLVIALMAVPAAWMAGRVDRVPLPPAREGGAVTASAAMVGAMRHLPFLVMASAYFVCGMQLVFLTTHLPSYLALCGMDPMLSAQALGMIGGCNVLGALFFGWAGGRVNKLLLLGAIYTSRSLMIAWYFASVPTPANTLLFAGVMGFLWLGVSPLVAGWVGETFGLRWQAMIGGMAFVTHQVGSAVGALGGGLAIDLLGSYSLAIRVGVSLGLAAGVVQILFALHRSSRAPVAVG